MTERRPNLFARLFVTLGVLPFLLVAAVVIFSLMSDNFLTVRNLTNVVRQSVYLTIVSLGQMFALLTGGFDLSVGTVLAITSVVGALTMATVLGMAPDMVWLAILVGCLGGIAAGATVGIANGIGVAVFGVSPFIMTLGISSIGFGIALYLTGGVPVYGMPPAFGNVFGFGDLWGLPVPIIAAAIVIVVVWVVVNRTRFGRYLYAVGGNQKAAALSGIDTKGVLFWTYIAVATLAAFAGMLLTARLDTGEANIGAAMPLESIAACVIAGVSLRGGVGRVENVVLGAFFIVLVQNGMNIARIESYLQTVVLGGLLILAVIADRIRLRMMAGMRA
jgi:ribose transport system permease protein